MITRAYELAVINTRDKAFRRGARQGAKVRGDASACEAMPPLVSVYYI